MKLSKILIIGIVLSACSILSVSGEIQDDIENKVKREEYRPVKSGRGHRRNDGKQGGGSHEKRQEYRPVKSGRGRHRNDGKQGGGSHEKREEYRPVKSERGTVRSDEKQGGGSREK
ncbi:4756_t:CDS:1 [Entrophospora sp. SA101]|nr:9919_t:CDS:1 [Entrophospora sp. SA101]CAJ0749508.1 10855_t:CDS:1 [Entrophospora sp. SA101]CAJ0750831.1 4756_t:CDS:1 [Entrophospora sp. SA101]CAJ0825279.1 689_t:CDS:1 [Entrophospora sp. SA101]CAJ0825295.1 694_t:CDS:1 [Entrophospora sp. SA101]